jgi:hypothetical protein
MAKRRRKKKGHRSGKKKGHRKNPNRVRAAKKAYRKMRRLGIGIAAKHRRGGKKRRKGKKRRGKKKGHRRGKKKSRRNRNPFAFLNFLPKERKPRRTAAQRRADAYYGW